jgi:hypothetical protein
VTLAPPLDPQEAWRIANQRHLIAAVDEVRARLDLHAQGRSGAEPREVAAVDIAERDLGGRTALRILCDRFGLSRFERLALTLFAAPELASGFGARCAAAANDARRQYPTFGLAMAALPEAHWSAFAPDAPLRYYCLVQVGDGELAHARARIDERALHFLLGTATRDERLMAIVELIPAGRPENLAPSQLDMAGQIAALWSRSEPPLIQLCGGEHAGKEAVLAEACSRMGCALHALRASDIALDPSQRDGLARLWAREALLAASALVIVVDDADHPEQVKAATVFAERATGLVAVASRDPLRLRRRLSARLNLERPSPDEQGTLWHRILGPLAERMNGQIGGIVAQFSLGMSAMSGAAAELRRRADGGEQEHELAALLWDACRSQARPRMDDLAQRIKPAASWDDIVLPPDQLQLVRDVAAHVRQRAKVYEQWGFSKRGSRGLGISAVFAGASGTGKTMAAEVIAAELDLDLYRVDLSQVVSKYIGETEKNLRRVFDAAEEGGAVLLFDEADALFGKRSEVKDSHDRYANLEVSYLLQRMEQYRGLAILTTNMRNALDTAFLRRLRFVVEFPFPGPVERAEIWRRIFPPATPREGLDVHRLARLNVPGGVIRNIALNAAFIAADLGEPVRMVHVRHATEIEFLKLERPLSEADLGGWS